MTPPVSARCNCKVCAPYWERRDRECRNEPEPDENTITVVVGSELRTWQHHSAPEEQAEVEETITLEFEEDPEMEREREAVLQALQFELVRQQVSPGIYLALKFLVTYL